MPTAGTARRKLWGPADAQRAREADRKWSRMAPVYDLGMKLLLLPLGGERRIRRRFLEIANVVEGTTVLDLGCATGLLTQMAGMAAGDTGRAAGVDRSQGMIQRALRTRTRASFACADVKELPFAEASFDRVIAFMVLHELDAGQRLAALREAARVLKPGGKLAVAEYSADARGMRALLLKAFVKVFEPSSAADILRGLHFEAIDSLFRVERMAEILRGLVQVTVARKTEPATA